MIKILNKKFLFTIVIFSSCNQNIEPVNEIQIQSNPTENFETQSTFVFDEIFIDESSLDEWTEFKLLKSDILDLSNSIQGYDSVIKFNQDILNKLSNSSTEIFSSDFELYNENPEIKGRLKLLNIQIQKTKYNFNRLNKSEALNELNKIIIYYNYSANMIVSKANDTIN
ncbi:hypothetical protein N9U80_00080 [Flavobacteriaceae bacterium]|jgi:hypothetical protein|nr:hypothetical protein [Flavobacteriaceae bacterium]